VELKIKNDGKQIGLYTLGKSIGEGTFGKVKIGTHLPTGEKVSYNRD
jgi:serine/threonine protein kinase